MIWPPYLYFNTFPERMTVSDTDISIHPDSPSHGLIDQIDFIVDQN